MSAPARTKHRLLLLVVITLAGGMLAGGACGGSSSESPWPVEPDSPVLGPAGEDGKTQPLDQLPDAGPDAPQNVEP